MKIKINTQINGYTIKYPGTYSSFRAIDEMLDTYIYLSIQRGKSITSIKSDFNEKINQIVGVKKKKEVK